MTDQTIPDTTPPPPETHGFLEQFEVLAHKAIIELESVVQAGLQPAENEALIFVAAKLVKLAQVHDSEALSKVEALL